LLWTIRYRFFLCACVVGSGRSFHCSSLFVACRYAFAVWGIIFMLQAASVVITLVPGCESWSRPIFVRVGGSSRSAMHNFAHTHTYTLMHSCTHMHTRARLWVRGGNALFICIGVSPLVVTNVFKTYAHARAHTHTHAHARTRTYSPTCTHTHTYTRIHTHAHTPACRPPACGDLDGRSSVDHNPISAAAAAARCGCAQLLFVQ